MTDPGSLPNPGAEREEAPEGPRVRDRQVVLVAAIVVVAVLATQVFGLFVPGFERLLALQPVMAIVLIVVTALVLAQALRGRTRRG